jgi:hypothetical protein
MNISVGTFIAIACQGEVGEGTPTNTGAPSATPNPPVIGTAMTYTAGTWSSGTPIFTRWEKSATGVGSWSTAAATMPNANSAPTDTEFGLYLRPVETNDGVEAAGAAVGPVGGLLGRLIAYWKLDEASGNRADSLGVHTLVDNNTVTQDTGKVGSAARFVAANTEHLSVADHVDLRAGDRDFACDCWFYADDVSGVKFILAQGTDTSGANLGFSLFLNNNNLSARMASGATNATITLGGSLTATTWYYAIVWYDAATNTLWGQLNGNAAVSGVLVGAANSPAGAFRLGTAQTVASGMTGRIDEVGRWNRILTGAERLQRYNGGSGNTYPF